ncbi:SPX domain-containing protein, partial [Haematococcus lacustris]
GAVVQSAASGVLSSDEAKFIATLNEDLTRFNQFFIDREEESVIQMQRLAEQLAAATTQEQVAPLKSALVEFHGNCILLLHWSLLNYAAVAKILKKHDKRTGVLLRAPCLANVLQQPFNSTSIMSRLVKQAEELLATAMSGGFPGPAQQASTTAGTSNAACCTATSRGDNRGARGAAQRGEGQEEDEASSASAIDEVQEEAVMVSLLSPALPSHTCVFLFPIAPSP